MTGCSDTHPDGFADLPPSAKLVYRVLEEEGEATQHQLADETHLPKRTIRYALERLDEIDVLEERPRLTDARQTWYSLSE